jgi:hypothetical protein
VKRTWMGLVAVLLVVAIPHGVVRPPDGRSHTRGRRIVWQKPVRS